VYVAQDGNSAPETMLVPPDSACGDPYFAELTGSQQLRFERRVQLGDRQHHIVVPYADSDFLADEQLLQRREQRPVGCRNRLGSSRTDGRQPG
jgi:hypothetical protein